MSWFLIRNSEESTKINSLVKVGNITDWSEINLIFILTDTAFTEDLITSDIISESLKIMFTSLETYYRVE